MAKGTVTVMNRANADVFVTIIDRNISKGAKIWDGKRFNRSAEADLQCEIDYYGKAQLEWTAVSTEDESYTNSGVETLEEGGTFDIVL